MELVTPTVLVAGDVTVDWHVAMPEVVAPGELATSYQWELSASAGLSAEPGGAALLTTLLERALQGRATVAGPELSLAQLKDPDAADLPRTFSLWQPHPVGPGRRELAWRMHRFLGVRPATGAPAVVARDNAPANSFCLVIDDAGFGFRDEEARWPAALRDGGMLPGRIVVKAAGALVESPLWTRLLALAADRLTAYVAAGDLRKGYAAIGQPHSWERTANEVVAAVRAHALLRLIPFVVVSLGLAGAVIVERDSATLVFDPLHQEGDWERLHPGTPTGLGTCIAAALVMGSLEDANSVADAVVRGLLAGRAVHESGLVRREDDDAIRFPLEAAAVAIQSGDASGRCFSVAPVEDASEWRLLPTASTAELRSLARRIVLEGDAEACRGIPIERIGAWTSVDRTEIESLRSVRHIVRQYLAQERRVRPLNLAVFGAPGSGKSFAVKQIAREWAGAGTRIEILEFNVSQFGGPADLAIALQRVRDAAVEHAVPLVFWDEFDATHEGRELGWLARFLAPMQDGVFFEGGMARPIGPAIFVFAGGTHATLASFKERAVAVPGAKATDFLSRLRGHIDVLGPNPRDDADPAYVLRRALLLRAQLLLRAPQLVAGGRPSIDPGVLRAFLEVPAYLHGARSLEAIVEMSGLSGRLRYERSALPAPHQLALHVDADAFLALVGQERST